MPELQPSRLYRVRVLYREPPSQSGQTSTRAPTHSVFGVYAASAEEAERQAVTEFWQSAARSSICWAQEIVAVDVEGPSPHQPLLFPELAAE